MSDWRIWEIAWDATAVSIRPWQMRIRRRIRICQGRIETAVASQAISQILQSLITNSEIQGEGRSQFYVVLRIGVPVGELPRAVKQTRQIDRREHIAETAAVAS